LRSYGVYNENQGIKKAAIEQFAFNQRNIEYYLNETLENKNDSTKVLFNLSKVTSLMDNNAQLAGNVGYIGPYINIPFEFFIINRDKGIIVFDALQEALSGSISDETIEQLLEYKEKISLVSEDLKESDTDSKSLNELYKLLNTTAQKLESQVE